MSEDPNLNNKYVLQSGDTIEVIYLKRIIDRQEQEIVGLTNKVEKLSISLSESKSVLSVSIDDRAQKCIENLKAHIDDLIAENKCLKKCLAPTYPKEENEALLELEFRSNTVLCYEVEELKKKLEKYENQKDDNSRIKVLEQKCEILTNRNEELENLVSTAKVEELEAKLQHLIKEKSALHTKLDESIHNSLLQETDLSIEIKHLREIIKEMEKENCELQANLKKTLKSNFDEASLTLKYLEHKVNTLEKEKLDLETRLSNNKRKLHEILGKLELNINQNSSQKADLEAEIQNFKKRVSQLEELNAALEQQLCSCNEKLLNLTNSKIIELENDKANLEAEKSLLEERITSMNKQQEEIIDNISGNSYQQIELENEVFKLKLKLKKQKCIIKEIENQLKETTESLAMCEDKEKRYKSDCEIKIEKIISQKNIYKREKDLLTKENNELLLRIAELQKKLARLKCDEERLNASNAANENLKSEMDILKKHYQEEILKVRLQVDTFKMENEKLKIYTNDLLKKLEITDNIDKLLQDRRAEKENLSEEIKRLQESLKNDAEKSIKHIEDLQQQIEKIQTENNILKIKSKADMDALQNEFDKNLILAKEQYNKDIQFLRGRHNDGINQLQLMHEDSLNSKIQEFELRIEDLNAQKQSYRDSLRSKRQEIDELRNQLENEKRQYETEVDTLRKTMEYEKRRTEEKISNLARKCWNELEKIKVLEMEKRLGISTNNEKNN